MIVIIVMMVCHHLLVFNFFLSRAKDAVMILIITRVILQGMIRSHGQYFLTGGNAKRAMRIVFMIVMMDCR